MNDKLATSGFTADGQRYILRDLQLMDRADADLGNDLLNIQIDQRGRCNAGFLQPNMTKYSEGLRAFYLRDDESGEIWSVPFEPVCKDPVEFEFSVGLADIQWRAVYQGVEVTLRLVVPREDLVELWTATVRNVGPNPRKISLYSYFPIGMPGLLTDKCFFDKRLNGIIHEYYPYYVRIEDYYKLKGLRNNVYCAADIKPVAFEANQIRFKGFGGAHNPDALQQEKLGNGLAPQEFSAAIMQFSFTLSTGDCATVNFVFGPAKDRAEMQRLKSKYLVKGGIEKALRAVLAFLKKYTPAVKVQTPDVELNHFLNYWLPRRTIICVRSLRYNFCPQGRNIIQDAMGATFTDPETARYWYTRIWQHQTADGWTPHGMPMAEGVAIMPITQIPHKDINAWGPVALHYYVTETGDMSLLNEQVPFVDDATPVSIYEHINRGLEWLLRDRTARGLCRLGQGDWNDPLNMAGQFEKGESVWLTMALILALDTWALVADERGDHERAVRYRAEAEASRNAINDIAWDGMWYARGSKDSGELFGVSTDKEGMIFLNPQSWSLISGTADGTRVDNLLSSVKRYLATKTGPDKIYPPFMQMDETIGKITQKCPGTGENGSVYCHAVTFLAYGLYSAGRPEEAFTTLRTLLPGYAKNTIVSAGQLPIYLPNYYRGSFYPSHTGQSSHSPNTGTAAWYYRTAIEKLLGVGADFTGLRLQPQLPRAWKTAKVTRDFRGARYNITIKKKRGAEKISVTLNGVPLPDNHVPLQAAGSSNAVIVTLPA